jgi:hypothetical protein
MIQVDSATWHMLDSKPIVDMLVADKALLRILQARLHGLGGVTTANWMRDSINSLHAHALEPSTGDAGWPLDVVVDATIVPIACTQLHDSSLRG